MTKHEALKDLAAVVRDTPLALPRLETGPAPLSPALRYRNSNSTQPQSPGSALLSQLVPALTGVSSGGSLLDGLLGTLGGTTKSSGSLLSVALGGGLAPVVSGLVNLIGGGSKSAPAPLPFYSAPQRVQAQAGLQGGVVTGADSNQSGMARSNSASSQPQVTMHIQAMDTQSILNRSSDIAQAVRQAMLQSHPINDVVADL